MVFNKVVEVFVDIMGFEPEEIERSSKVFDELDADSLDIAQIILALENAYQISIDNQFLKEMETIEDLVKHVESLI